MQPDQPHQYSIDYLNQIAAPPPRTGPTNKTKVLLAVIGALLLAFIAIVLLSSLAHGPKTDMETLTARLQTLQKVATDSQPNIKDSQLQSYNSNLTIYLTNANRDITGPLQNNGIDSTKLDPAIVAKENGATLSDTLENARLNAVFDRTYAREMTYQLSTVIVLMTKIDRATGSQSMHRFITTNTSDLKLLQSEFSQYNAAAD